MKIKIDLTHQDYRDLQTIIDGLFATTEYITELVPELEEHHKEMIDSCDYSIELLKELSDEWCLAHLKAERIEKS